jgi:deoxyuridine 5'-triphosphate nucleotidohydrolase
MKEIIIKNIYILDDDKLVCTLKNNHEVIETLDTLKIPYDYDTEQANYFLIVSGTNYVDLIGLISTSVNDLKNVKIFGEVIPLQVVRTDPMAIVPHKIRMSDVGYDLSIIKFHKQLTKTTVLYDTGIKVSVPWGWYLEIVPRSSLSKTGYSLANSIGIIESSYRGNLYVAVTKTDPDAKDLELPFRGFQLIIRKQYHADIIDCESLTVTQRGDGGFGSTSSS